jgi:hypothetical protein
VCWRAHSDHNRFLIDSLPPYSLSEVKQNPGSGNDTPRMAHAGDAYGLVFISSSESSALDVASYRLVGDFNMKYMSAFCT